MLESVQHAALTLGANPWNSTTNRANLAFSFMQCFVTHLPSNRQFRSQVRQQLAEAFQSLQCKFTLHSCASVSCWLLLGLYRYLTFSSLPKLCEYWKQLNHCPSHEACSSYHFPTIPPCLLGQYGRAVSLEMACCRGKHVLWDPTWPFTADFNTVVACDHCQIFELPSVWTFHFQNKFNNNTVLMSVFSKTNPQNL